MLNLYLKLISHGFSVCGFIRAGSSDLHIAWSNLHRCAPVDVRTGSMCVCVSFVEGAT